MVTMTRSLPSGRTRHGGWAARRPPRSAAERRALLDALEDPRHWPEAAASLVAELGFRLIEADRSADDDSHLLIALRDRPTLRHFDPEAVAYYRPVSGGAALTTIDRHNPAPVGGRSDRPVLWGHVHVLDRIPVENRFLTFGGDLRMATIDSTLTVADLWSPAPIVRWGGHSQGTDALTQAIGAFFGRLIVPVDFVPGAAARIDALLPEVLYRAFLADARRRASAAALLNAGRSDLDAWLAAAWARAQGSSAACAAAEELLADLDL
jgi:hypothetical protein